MRLKLKQNLLHVPPGIDIVTFVEFDGKPPDTPPDEDRVTISGLRDRYLKAHENGSLEQSSLDGIGLHFKHVVGTLGENFPMPSGKACCQPKSFCVSRPSIRIPLAGQPSILQLIDPP